MGDFIPGLKLSKLFFFNVVEPILTKYFPNLDYSAGLIGPGSEILGFDTEISTDHNWGPRVLIFLSKKDYKQLAKTIVELMGQKLPFSFQGYSTHFVPSPSGNMVLKDTNERPINHKVEVLVLEEFVKQKTGIDLHREMTLNDWLITSEQHLQSLVAGAVFHDKLGVLEPMRSRLAYYPNELWLYLLSAQWLRIGQEEAFVGRTGYEDDNIGSAIIATRLVRDLMRLCFLMEKQYAPYSKWFAKAFIHLKCAKQLTPIFERIIQAKNWQNREKHLSAAYGTLIKMHNKLGITKPIPAKVRNFHNRPFMIIGGGKMADTIWENIKDEEVKSLPFGIGKVDQFIDSTDILSYPHKCCKLKALYQKNNTT